MCRSTKEHSVGQKDGPLSACYSSSSVGRSALAFTKPVS